MAFTINGKSYPSMHAFMEDVKNNPESDTLVWEYRTLVSVVKVNGKVINPEGNQGRGKCFYHGRTFEGDVEIRNGQLWVGGEYVKDLT